MNHSLSATRRLTGSVCISLLLAGCGGKSHTDATRADPTPSIEADKGLFLAGVIDANATACVAKGDEHAPLLASGTLDVAFSTAYTAVVLVGNELPQLDSSAAPTSVTERVSMRSAEVTLQAADGTVIGSYSTVGTGFIDAAPGGAASYGAMAVTVISATLGATDPVKTASDLVAKIRVKGEALDGTALTSTELDFPIHVCNGCLVRYPASARDPTVPAQGEYRCSTADLSDKTPSPCIVGQDAPFSCALCSVMYDFCRDPKLNPSAPPAD